MTEQEFFEALAEFTAKSAADLEMSDGLAVTGPVGARPVFTISGIAPSTVAASDHMVNRVRSMTDPMGTP